MRAGAPASHELTKLVEISRCLFGWARCLVGGRHSRHFWLQSLRQVARRSQVTFRRLTSCEAGTARLRPGSRAACVFATSRASRRLQFVVQPDAAAPSVHLAGRAWAHAATYAVRYPREEGRCRVAVIRYTRSMAYAKFSDTCDWYIYWAGSDASSPEDERLEVLRARGSARPVVVSFAEADRAAKTGALPRELAGLQANDHIIILAALREFASDVQAHYATTSEPSPVTARRFIAEGERASDLLRRKAVAVVRRPSARHLVVEFSDGTRMLVHATGDELELSIE